MWVFVRDITERRRAEASLEKRLIALSKPLDDPEGIYFHDLFNMDDIQRIQDLFAAATGVASIITNPDGTPITKPSNFCRLCIDIIRQTELGLKNCYFSDAIIGRHHPEGPIVQPCFSGGLWDAGASITIGGRHIANWLIGQVRNEAPSEENIREYARQIGVNEEEFIKAFYEVNTMPESQFKQVADALFALANQLSAVAYQNVQQARFITERKQAEENLRQTRDYLENLINYANAPIIVWDTSFRITQFNRAFENLTGHSAHEVVGQELNLLFPEDSCEESLSKIARTSGGEYWESVEIPILHKDGDIRIVLWNSANIHTEDGATLVATIAQGQDITERKQAEDALRESEEAHRALVHGLPDIVMRLDRDGRFLFISDNVSEMVDLKAAQFIGKTYREFGFPEAQCRFWEEAIQGVFDSGAPFETEFTFEGKQGPTIYNWRLLPERDAQGMVRSVLSLSRDITAHRRAEENYRTLFCEMLDGFALHEIICDEAGYPADYRFLAVNPAFERMTGLKAEELVGRTVLEALPGIERHWIETYGKVALTGEPAFFENYSAELKKHFEVTAFRPTPNQFACIFADITEYKQSEEEKAKLEAQLVQAQKMEVIGTLAGGIAHDFNNILGAISGFTELTLQSVLRDSQEYYNLSQVLIAGERARDLVKQILVFSRRTVQARRPLQVSSIIEEALKLLRASLPTTIEIQQKLAAPSALVLADPTQIHQILMNLGSNAAHAMREDGGLLEINLAEVYLDGGDLVQHPDLTPGPYVRLTVRDTGQGMDQEIMGRIFEPFFTTKEVGEGTGMGLAVVHGIVKSSGGEITVSSQPGQGTTFTILLPKVAGEVATASAAPAPLPTGGDSILFIDDEEMLVNMIREMLKKLGYKIVTQTSSLAALKLFQAQPEKFDLVITDQTMPHMTGMQLAQELRQLRPDIPVILCTGYSEKVSAENVKAAGINELLMKPIIMRNLAETIRKVLD